MNQEHPNNFTKSFAPLAHRDSKELEAKFNEISCIKPVSKTARIRAMAVRISLVCTIIISIATAVGAGLWLEEIGFFDIQKSRLEVLINKKYEDNSIVFDSKNRKIGEFFNSYHVYVPYDKIPPHLVNAIISIEDRDFFNHSGIDPKGMLRAAFSYLKERRYAQGASTITQQIVRNFVLTRQKTLQRKILEIRYAIELEKLISKKKIFEIYANSLFLGNGAYGIGAAAYRYFGKKAEDLQPHESALIAGLFQSPSRYNPAKYPKKARLRQKQVIKAMYAAKHLKFAEAKKILRTKLRYKDYVPFNQELAPYFVDHVRNKIPDLLKNKKNVNTSGLRIYTTLDLDIQKMAETSLKESANLLNKAEDQMGILHRRPSKGGPKTREASLEAAILSVDPRNGHIKAMVGGRDYKEKSQFNRTIQAQRSPGSAFKPIIYSYALENNWKWSDVLYVAPINISNYKPRNPVKDFLSETTMFRAFYKSMNTPTIELGQKLGLKKILDYAKKLGIRSPIKEEFGSLLGSSDVNMIDLARVYGSFANQGTQIEPITITRIEDREGNIVYKAPDKKDRSKRVISSQISYLMTQGMRAVLQMGTGYKSAHLSNLAAGKTGTSNDSTDNWFCGYTSNLVSIVWVGTDENSTIHGNATGGTYALPIWDKYMSKFISYDRPKKFHPPRGVTTAVIDSRYGQRAATGVRMPFLTNNPPKREEASATEALSHLHETKGGFRDVFAH